MRIYKIIFGVIMIKPTAQKKLFINLCLLYKGKMCLCRDCRIWIYRTSDDICV